MRGGDAGNRWTQGKTLVRKQNEKNVGGSVVGSPPTKKNKKRKTTLTGPSVPHTNKKLIRPTWKGPRWGNSEGPP